jgi:hypothetical protein
LNPLKIKNGIKRIWQRNIVGTARSFTVPIPKNLNSNININTIV